MKKIRHSLHLFLCGLEITELWTDCFVKLETFYRLAFSKIHCTQLKRLKMCWGSWNTIIPTSLNNNYGCSQRCRNEVSSAMYNQTEIIDKPLDTSSRPTCFIESTNVFYLHLLSVSVFIHVIVKVFLHALHSGVDWEHWCQKLKVKCFSRIIPI